MADNNIYDSTFLGNLGGNISNIASGIGGAVRNFWDTGLSFKPSSWGTTSGGFFGSGSWGYANAAVSGLFAALGSIGSTLTAGRVYDMYKRQEQFDIANAVEQARRLQLKGDIALRNLEVKHITTEGKNELGVAAAGGRLSGSFLDSLVQNQKYDMMDERTSQIQTLWDVSNTRRAGYIAAASTAGQSMSYALQNRGSALRGLTAFISTASNSLLKDKQAANKINALSELANFKSQLDWAKSLTEFGSGVDLTGTASASLGSDATEAAYSGSGVGRTLQTNPNLPLPTLFPDIPYSSTHPYGQTIRADSMEHTIDSLLQINV